MSPERVLAELRSVMTEFRQSSTYPLVTESLAQRVIALLLTFKSDTLTPEFLQTLQSEKIWPCQFWRGGALTFICLTDNITFFIPDHLYFMDVFDEQFPILKLSPDNITELEPLLIKLGLKDNFLSRCVEGVEPMIVPWFEDNEMSRDLKGRAYALSCCMTYLAEDGLSFPKAKMDNLLENIQVSRVSEASTKYTISFRDFKKSKIALRPMRLEEKDNHLKLLVPSNVDTSTKASKQSLAKVIIRHFGISNKDASKIITAVLTIEKTELGSFLLQEGILGTDSTCNTDVYQAEIDAVTEKLSAWHLSIDRRDEDITNNQPRPRAKSSLVPTLVIDSKLSTGSHTRSKSNLSTPKKIWTLNTIATTHSMNTPSHMTERLDPATANSTTELQPMSAPASTQTFTIEQATNDLPVQELPPLEEIMTLDGKARRTDSFLHMLIQRNESLHSSEETLRQSLRFVVVVLSISFIYLKIRL